MIMTINHVTILLAVIHPTVTAMRMMRGVPTLDVVILPTATVTVTVMMRDVGILIATIHLTVTHMTIKQPPLQI